jgi:hypothetical protein
METTENKNTFREIMNENWRIMGAIDHIFEQFEKEQQDYREYKKEKEAYWKQVELKAQVAK